MRLRDTRRLPVLTPSTPQCPGRCKPHPLDSPSPARWVVTKYPEHCSGSHMAQEGLRAGPHGGCVTAAGSLHLPRLHSLSSKMRMLTPPPFPGRLDHREQRCGSGDPLQTNSILVLYPAYSLTSASVYQGLATSSRGRPLPPTSESTGPFLTCWEGGVGSPQVDPSPTPHQQSPSEVARTLLLAPQLFLKCSSKTSSQLVFLLASQPGPNQPHDRAGAQDSETSQDCFCP